MYPELARPSVDEDVLFGKESPVAAAAHGDELEINTPSPELESRSTCKKVSGFMVPIPTWPVKVMRNFSDGGLVAELSFVRVEKTRASSWLVFV